MNYVYIARFWFAVAALYAIQLYIQTSKRSYSDIHADVRLRPLFWIWMAASSVAGPAYAVSRLSYVLYIN